MNVYMDDVRQCPYIGWNVVRTVEETKKLLESGQVNHLSLDHDMGACSYCVQKQQHIGDMKTFETTFSNWCPHVEDGTKLVRWMIETGNWSKKRPVVHSANPAGRLRMEALIERYWVQRTDYWEQYPDRKIPKL